MAQPEMFGESAAYERFMGRWSRRLAAEFITFAGIQDGDAVLDVGSGTGACSCTVAAALPAVQIVGVEPAGPFVAYANAQTNQARVRFVVGNAQHLEFADRTFDRVISLLVMNFISNPEQALREMVRVATPGGTVAAAVWDYGEGMQMLRAFWDAAIGLHPVAGGRDEARMPLCRRGELEQLWQSGGLVQIEGQALTIPMVFASFEDYWAPFLGGQGPAGAYLRGLPEAERQTLAETLRRRLLADGDGPVTLHGRAWAVRGVKGL